MLNNGPILSGVIWWVDMRKPTYVIKSSNKIFWENEKGRMSENDTIHISLVGICLEIHRV
jgi:hypothetical protein